MAGVGGQGPHGVMVMGDVRTNLSMIGLRIGVGLAFVSTSLGACSTVRDADETHEGVSLSGIGSATDDDGSAGADDGTSGIKLDVEGGTATQGGADGGTIEGCGKIDFLFVIDSSGSMGGKQENLIASFPGFISTIRDVLGIDDYQILVADTDDGSGGGSCFQQTTTQDCGAWCQQCLAQGCTCTCNNQPCPVDPTTDCDKTLGGGKIADLNGTSCPIQGDQRFLVGGQPNLNEAFECIARVGVEGSGDEQPMGAMVKALSTEVGPGGCNEGFLRDDAILVVTVITDEEDDPNDAPGDGCAAIDTDPNSPGDPAAWRQAVVEAKAGDEQAVVLLALLGDCDVPNGICQPLEQIDGVWVGGEPSPRLRTFAESFTYGMWASVCAPDYNVFFQEAVSVIDTACDGFDPPA
jgi:hypothetical protein